MTNKGKKRMASPISINDTNTKRTRSGSETLSSEDNAVPDKVMPSTPRNTVQTTIDDKEPENRLQILIRQVTKQPRFWANVNNDQSILNIFEKVSDAQGNRIIKKRDDEGAFVFIGIGRLIDIRLRKSTYKNINQYSIAIESPKTTTYFDDGLHAVKTLVEHNETWKGQFMQTIRASRNYAVFKNCLHFPELYDLSKSNSLKEPGSKVGPDHFETGDIVAFSFTIKLWGFTMGDVASADGPINLLRENHRGIRLELVTLFLLGHEKETNDVASPLKFDGWV